ncbi:uncharacterized protein J7T54_000294 [Emericellopsis cladophorae]|uniref:Hemerythrin-like domain-containing protein n=1 Tax=Emericellopsis cladophorae TaxID=2686198 RepID=A0A9P9XX23_9HYPO|nr:uncharacterized protein J7T54_000294 [Emericellopsis cladophorae]KAI6779148.1 hypothetical protein J7T54_000294 [Emericellopsis cladophorae]
MSTNDSKSAASPAAEKKLPPLSDHDFRIYNNMADHMDLFHNNFRQSWNLLWQACCNNKRPRNLTLKQFLDEGLRFIQHLTVHHNIEEQHIFPVLAKKMPEFRGDLQAQHKLIHAGMDRMADYLRGCKTGEYEFELSGLKARMETWGDVLWTHLDDEVRTLGAENMRKYWTKEEMVRMPM